MQRTQRLVVVVLVGAALLTGCGDKGSSRSARSTTTLSEESTVGADADETASTLKQGAQPGLFDFNQDGTKEPTCGTADYHAELVIRTYCDDLSGYANSPESDATLVLGALFGQPTPPDDPRASRSPRARRSRPSTSRAPMAKRSSCTR